MQPMNVLLIGDEDRCRAVKEGLGGHAQVRLAGEITESQVLPLVPQLQADVIVLDFGATRVNGLAVLPWLAVLPAKPTIIVLGASGVPAERRLALELGASSYVPPDSPVQALGALITAPPPRALPLARAA